MTRPPPKNASVAEHKRCPDADQHTDKCEDIGIDFDKSQNLDNLIEDVLSSTSDSVAKHGVRLDRFKILVKIKTNGNGSSGIFWDPASSHREAW